MKTPGKKRSLLIVTFILLASCIVTIAVTVPRTIFSLNAGSYVAGSSSLLSQGDNGPLAAAYIRDISSTSSASVASPLITTNKTGFLAGETLTVSGSGYLPGQAVTLQVTHSDGSAESGANHEPFTATADTIGNFTANWTVGRDSAGNSFTLLADGSAVASI